MTLLTKPVSRETKPCSACAGNGWYAWGQTDNPIQLQCRWCLGTGQDVFNLAHSTRLAQSREAVAGLDKVREGFKK